MSEYKWTDAMEPSEWDKLWEQIKATAHTIPLHIRPEELYPSPVMPNTFAGGTLGEPFNMKWLAEDGVHPTNQPKPNQEVRSMNYEEITQVMPFYGLRVMINPERMERYDSSLLGLSGNILKVEGSESGCMEVMRTYKCDRNYTGSWQVRVTFDNGVTKSVRIRDMLLVNGVHKNVHYFETNKNTYYKFDDDFEKMCDKIIIEQGGKIYKHKIYNEEYCRKIFAKA